MSCDSRRPRVFTSCLCVLTRVPPSMAPRVSAVTARSPSLPAVISAGAPPRPSPLSPPRWCLPVMKSFRGPHWCRYRQRPPGEGQRESRVGTQSKQRQEMVPLPDQVALAHILEKKKKWRKVLTTSRQFIEEGTWMATKNKKHALGHSNSGTQTLRHRQCLYPSG